MRQPAKANCTMPQPTAYADALGHYLYLPGWEGGLQVEGAPQCEKWRRKAGTKSRARFRQVLLPLLELRSETDPEKPTRPKAAIRAGCCCCACLVCAGPLYHHT